MYDAHHHIFQCDKNICKKHIEHYKIPKANSGKFNNLMKQHRSTSRINISHYHEIQLQKTI